MYSWEEGQQAPNLPQHLCFFAKETMPREPRQPYTTTYRAKQDQVKQGPQECLLQKKTKPSWVPTNNLSNFRPAAPAPGHMAPAALDCGSNTESASSESMAMVMEHTHKTHNEPMTRPSQCPAMKQGCTVLAFAVRFIQPMWTGNQMELHHARKRGTDVGFTLRKGQEQGPRTVVRGPGLACHLLLPNTKSPTLPNQIGFTHTCFTHHQQSAFISIS